MKIKSTILISAVALGVFGAACSTAPAYSPEQEVKPSPEEKPTPGEYRLPLVETTDIHGNIVEYKDGVPQYRMAYIADKVNDIRGEDRDRMILLDGGDLYQGASVSNLLDGWPVYVSIDRMGYDAVALGNHEFDWDITALTDPDATLPDYEWQGSDCVNKVPVLCANLYRNGSRTSCTRDYVIVEKEASRSNGETVKVRVGIIGFAPNFASSIMTSKFSGKGYSITEDYDIADNIAAELEKSGKCDATVLLTHGRAEYAAERLDRNSAIDLVLGGHSHQTLKGTSSSGIAYLQGGCYGKYYAYSELVFDYAGKQGGVSFKRVANQLIREVSGDLSGRDGQNFDPEIKAISDEALSATSDVMNDVVGYITYGATTYSLNGSGGRASVMSNWMCDILREIGEADVAFVNIGGIRTSFPLEGNQCRDITVADIYEMFPFSNTTYVFRITYAELLRLFEFSLTDGGDALFSCMTGIDCHYNGRTVLALVKDGRTIYQNGRWADGWDTRTLTLAASEYLATSVSTDFRTGLSNPLPEWNKTSRLLNDSEVDNENAVRVLRKEAAVSGGHLWLDIQPHYLLEE